CIGRPAGTRPGQSAIRTATSIRGRSHPRRHGKASIGTAITISKPVDLRKKIRSASPVGSTSTSTPGTIRRRSRTRSDCVAKPTEASGEFGSVAVASEAEANVAARVWAGAGSRVITASHGGASATGEVVGRIAADGARVARFAAPKVNGTVAANLENVLTGS